MYEVWVYNVADEILTQAARTQDVRCAWQSSASSASSAVDSPALFKKTAEDAGDAEEGK